MAFENSLPRELKSSDKEMEFPRKDKLLNNPDALKVVSVRELEEVVDCSAPVGSL